MSAIPKESRIRGLSGDERKALIKEQASRKKSDQLVVYAAEEDPLCYPGTTVLRNKLNIGDQAELDEFELALFLTRADEQIPAGNLDYEHYKAVHHHLFQDIYEWAGEVRTVRIGKGGNWFCYPIEGRQDEDRAYVRAGTCHSNALHS